MPSPTLFSFTIKDYSGAKATVLVPVAFDAATETVGALLGNLSALGGYLDPVTAGEIIECRAIIDMAPDPAWKQTPIASIEVEQTLLLGFVQANSKYTAEIDVPALRDTLIDSTGKPIVGSGAIATLVTQLTQDTGISGSDTVFANSLFSNALEALRSAAVSFRKHRRKRRSVSVVTPA